MRFFAHSIVVVLLAGLNTAYASGTGFTAGSYQITDVSLYCDKPVRNDEEQVISTAVHPIWQVEIRHLDLGYIEDDFSLTELLPAVSLQAETNSHPTSASTDSIGVQLDNGWALGLTYETIDTSLKLGSVVEESSKSSIGPVYEGPMFVATLKFR